MRAGIFRHHLVYSEYKIIFALQLSNRSSISLLIYVCLLLVAFWLAFQLLPTTKKAAKKLYTWEKLKYASRMIVAHGLFPCTLF